MSSENYEANGYGAQFGSVHHLALIACFTSYEQRVQEKSIHLRHVNLTPERLKPFLHDNTHGYLL